MPCEDGGAIREALALARGLPSDFAGGLLDGNEGAIAVLVIVKDN